MHHPLHRLFGLLAAAAALVAALPAAAQSYPTRPITLIVGWAAGGGTDSIARSYARELGQVLKQNVVVENRPGAGGIIGAQHVAAAQPDGYTLLFGTQATTGTGPVLQRRLPYDPKKDFTMIAFVMTQPNVIMVNKDVKATTLQELIDLAKAKPRSLNYGSAGIGALSHFAMELLMVQTGTKLVHVPYKGGAEALTGVHKGEIEVNINNIEISIPVIRSGAVRALAVTGADRMDVLKGVPTVAETVPGYSLGAWEGLMAPANLPHPIVETLYNATMTALKTPALRQFADSIGGTPGTMTREQFIAFIDADAANWRRAAEAGGIKPQ